MALRTDPESVKSILLDQYDGSSSLDPFILSANSLTDYVDVKDTASLLSSSSLELIERYLAAHFYVSGPDQMFSNRSTGRASGGFQGQTQMVLDYSPYGQHAKLLDVTGTLAALEQQAKKGRMKVTAMWLGTRYRHDFSERSADQ